MVESTFCGMTGTRVFGLCGSHNHGRRFLAAKTVSFSQLLRTLASITILTELLLTYPSPLKLPPTGKQAAVSSAPVLTQYMFDWSVREVGTLMAVLGLVVLPVNIIVGRLSLVCEDR